MFNGLYGVWNDAKRRGINPAWANVGQFIAWAHEAGYKAAYGYKGEFTPENLKFAIPQPKIENFAAAMTSYVTGKADMETLLKMKVVELKELAADMDIELKGATTKKEIAEKIAEVQNG